MMHWENIHRKYLSECVSREALLNKYYFIYRYELTIVHGLTKVYNGDLFIQKMHPSKLTYRACLVWFWSPHFERKRIWKRKNERERNKTRFIPYIFNSASQFGWHWHVTSGANSSPLQISLPPLIYGPLLLKLFFLHVSPSDKSIQTKCINSFPSLYSSQSEKYR